MIKRWLQLTCDLCGHTEYGPTPRCTVAEARTATLVLRVRSGQHRGKDACYDCMRHVRAGDTSPAKRFMPGGPK